MRTFAKHDDYTRETKLPPGAKWKTDPNSERYPYHDEGNRPKFIVIRQLAWQEHGLPVLNERTGKQVKRYIQNWWGVLPDRKKPKGARR
ncbi:MAG TPA: hypothetical protein VH593_01825, partial [Ktedonobacteraceae bacterium]